MSRSGWKLGSLPLPLDAGPEAAADPQLLQSGQTLRFGFEFQKVAFAAAYEGGVTAATVHIQADLGPLPFSAQSPAARVNVGEIIRTAQTVLGAGSLKIHNGRIALDAAFSLPQPVTAIGLMSGLTRFLLRAGPFLDCLAVFVRPPLTLKRGESPVQPAWRRVR